MIEASAEDPRITRRAPSLVPRVSPSCGAGWGARRGAETRSRGSPPRRGGSRAQPSLTVQDPDGGWNALFQSKPPPAGTHPLSRPRQKRPPGVCLGACRGIDSPQSPGKGEPEAPLPRGACNSHPSPSVLLRVGPRRHRNTADPRSLQRGSFPLTICPSLSLLYVFRGGGKVLPCLSSPWCGERSRQNRAEETSGGAWLIARLPSQWSLGCGAALASHKSTNVVRTAIWGRGHSSPSHLGPASERRVLPEVQEVDASSVIGLEATARRL